MRLPVDMQVTLAFFACSLCAFLLFAVPAFAQPAGQPMPENASAKGYGGSWECNLGYRTDGNLCAAIVVPANAYQTRRTYGTGWDCLHGFRKSDESTCVEVLVPEGGFLDPSGERWQCARGYLMVDEGCQEIALPANAYLADTYYGSEWICERGFKATADSCNAITVPLNAHLNTSGYGQPWTCERGFFEQDGLCAAVIIPAHAYFDDATYGNGWKCERGYAASGDGCEAVTVPANAHLDRSGNRWECNKSFQKSKDLCVLSN